MVLMSDIDYSSELDNVPDPEPPTSTIDTTDVVPDDTDSVNTTTDPSESETAGDPTLDEVSPPDPAPEPPTTPVVSDADLTAGLADIDDVPDPEPPGGVITPAAPPADPEPLEIPAGTVFDNANLPDMIGDIPVRWEPQLQPGEPAQPAIPVGYRFAFSIALGLLATTLNGSLTTYVNGESAESALITFLVIFLAVWLGTGAWNRVATPAPVVVMVPVPIAVPDRLDSAAEPAMTDLTSAVDDTAGSAAGSDGAAGEPAAPDPIDVALDMAYSAASDPAGDSGPVSDTEPDPEPVERATPTLRLGASRSN
jgi:hypothetical protein